MDQTRAASRGVEAGGDAREGVVDAGDDVAAFLEPRLDRGTQSGDRGGCDEPQLEGRVAAVEARSGPGLEGLEDRFLPALLTLDLVRAQRRGLRHDPRLLEHARPVVLQAGEVLDQALADRAQRRLAGGAAEQPGDEQLALLVGVAQEQRLLVGEVAEEGARGHVARLDDLLDRGAVEALLGEEVEGRLLQGFAGLELLPLAQAHRLVGRLARRLTGGIARGPPHSPPWLA